MPAHRPALAARHQRGRKARVGGLVYHIYPRRGQLKHRADVGARGLGDGDYRLGAVGGCAHLAVKAARIVVEDGGELHEGQVVDGDHGGAGAIARGHKVWAVQQIKPLRQQLKRQAPLLEAVVRRGEHGRPAHVRRHHERPRLAMVLERHELLVRGVGGHGGQQQACVLGDPALAVGVQARVDADPHSYSLATSTVRPS